MIRIEGLVWDEEAEEHIARHGVTIEEVEQAVYNHRYARKSRVYLLLLGQTEAGRYLTVILDDLSGGWWWVVTAKPSKPSERKLLRRAGTAKEVGE